MNLGSELIEKYVAPLESAVAAVEKPKSKLTLKLNFSVNLRLWEEFRDLSEKINLIETSAPKKNKTTFNVFLRALAIYGAGYLGALGPEWEKTFTEHLRYLSEIREKYQEMAKEEAPK